MLFKPSSLISILSLVSGISAASLDQTGDGTFYNPDGGIGKCGNQLQNSDMICALGSDFFQQMKCGDCLEVTGPSGKVIVQDLCAGCKGFDVDMSPAAFAKIAPLSAGRVKVSSKPIACPSSSSPSSTTLDDADAPQESDPTQQQPVVVTKVVEVPN